MKFVYDHNLKALKAALKDIRKRFPEEEQEARVEDALASWPGDKAYVTEFKIEADYGYIGTIGWHGDDIGFWAITDIKFENEED